MTLIAIDKNQVPKGKEMNLAEYSSYIFAKHANYYLKTFSIEYKYLIILQHLLAILLILIFPTSEIIYK